MQENRLMRSLFGFYLACVSNALWVSAVRAQLCPSPEVHVGGIDRECVKPGGGLPFRDCPECPQMVVVPSGAFTMGSRPHEEVAAGHEDQVPVRVSRPFAVGRYAVTRAEFAAFLRASGHQMPQGCYRFNGSEWKRDANSSWQSPGFEQNDRHPAVCLSWNDARAYVAWLSSSTGKNYRLLSEAEREYVARAGSETPFWWGSTISTEQANYDGRISYGDGQKGEWRQGTVPVEAFEPNPWGLHNVHGNVWEWVEDCWNAQNAGNPGDGAARLTGDCDLRAMRGGSWNNGPHTIRSARRNRNPAVNRDGFMGFRVGRTLEAF
jgi:formylglycine-generating enzyme required for sulfatase activity